MLYVLCLVTIHLRQLSNKKFNSADIFHDDTIEYERGIYTSLSTLDIRYVTDPVKEP